MNSDIKKILNSLKKPCHKITYKQRYEYWEDADPDIFKTSCYIFDEAWVRDDSGRDFVFQIINDEGLCLPKEIAKIQLYHHLDNCSMNLVVTNDPVTEYIKPENIKNTNGVMYFKSSYNLPDWETLKGIHTNEFELIKSIMTKDKEEFDWEIYDDFIENVLGHKNYHSFVGGHLNLTSELIKRPSDNYQFIMQIETECNGGDTVYIFQDKKNTKKYHIESAR